MTYQHTFQIQTDGRGTYDISRDVKEVVSQSGIKDGICHLFIHHTSASLVLCENADPSVHSDLENFMARLVPDGDPLFHHTMEGPDDMPAHIRSILSKMDLTFPVTHGRSALGTWQGIYVWEHRTSPHTRKVTVTVIGD